MATEPRILIIGAGVAGSACAIRLRQHGMAVEIAERESFPRDKVCGGCLGGTGVSWLDALGMGEWVARAAIPARRWIGSLGGYRVDVPLPGGALISRRSLDTEMLRRAAALGAIVHQPCTAAVDHVGDGAVRVRWQGNGVRETHEFSIVVIASGLNAPGLRTALPWIEPPRGPFGVSMRLTASELTSSGAIEPGTIYMACDDDGYAGLVQWEDGRVDVAAALRRGAAAAGDPPAVRVQRLLDRSRLPIASEWEIGGVLTTPPLRRLRVAGQGRLLAVGDAAGYVEPFTGEGMTWALEAGVEAADWIAKFHHDASRLGDRWRERWEPMQHLRRRRCEVVTMALRSRRSRQMIGAVLSRFPLAAWPLVRSLNRSARVGRVDA